MFHSQQLVPLEKVLTMDIDFIHSSYTFPEKLFVILEKETGKNVIEWCEKGICFLIIDEKSLLNEIIPRYFKQKKIASFYRQLNSYGFRKITRGNEYGSYFHPKFQRNHPELLSDVQRLPLKRSGFCSYNAFDVFKRKDHQSQQQPPLPISFEEEGSVSSLSTVSGIDDERSSSIFQDFPPQDAVFTAFIDDCLGEEEQQQEQQQGGGRAVEQEECPMFFTNPFFASEVPKPALATVTPTSHYHNNNGSRVEVPMAKSPLTATNNSESSSSSVIRRIRQCSLGSIAAAPMPMPLPLYNVEDTYFRGRDLRSSPPLPLPMIPSFCSLQTTIRPVSHNNGHSYYHYNPSSSSDNTNHGSHHPGSAGNNNPFPFQFII